MPGDTTRPSASISRVACSPRKRPTATMRWSRTATSARRGASPEPSTTVPPRTIRSYMLPPLALQLPHHTEGGLPPDQLVHESGLSPDQLAHEGGLSTGHHAREQWIGGSPGGAPRVMNARGGDQAPDPPFVAGKGCEQFEHAPVVAPLLATQCEAEVAPDVPVVEGNGPCVAVGEMADQPDRPRPDTRQRAQSRGDPFDVVSGRSQPVSLSGQRVERPRPMEVEADTQQIVTAQSGHDLGPRRSGQLERAGRVLAVTAYKAPPAL